MSFGMIDPGDGSTLADPTRYSLLTPGGINPHLLSENALSAIEQAVGELPSFSKPQTPPNSRFPTTNGFHLDSACTCLTRVLGLVGPLFPHGLGSCQSAKSISADAGNSPLPTLQSVIADNEKTLDAISSMLPCPCSHDGYLLALMSLIVFKVMGWYAAASRHTPSPRESSRSSSSFHSSGAGHHCQPSEQVQHAPAVVGSYCVDGEDQGRMAAQLVLSELHRVQRLVNVLSQRLKSHTARGGSSNSSHSADGSGGAGAGTPSGSSVDGSDPFSDRDRDLTFPFPPSVLEQLEVDLRRRLRGLSAEIVDMLRRG
ncbi:aflatoxin regulatory protein-domain-containing protein [Aspergillus floccosus]